MGVLPGVLVTCTSPILHSIGACGCRVQPYACVAADPPWAFGDKLPGGTRGAAKRYDVMTTDQLCRLVLPPFADDAILFLWRVSAMVEEAYDVVRAWQFDPKTEIVWRKQTTRGNRHFGMGRTLRAEHETCIVATRGRPTILNKSTRTVFDAAEVEGLFEAVLPSRVHSRKPPEFYGIVESLCPAPRLELFAREERSGWTCIGDQLPNNPVRLVVAPA